MKQTAVDWLVDQMFRNGYFDGNKPLSFTNLDHLQHQAKQIEKEQIMKTMTDRIQIGGVWYVRESTLPKQKPLIVITDDQLTHSRHCIYEAAGYSWDASKLYKNSTEFWGGLGIEFTDFNSEEKVDEYWDNTSWFMSVYRDEEEAIETAREIMSEEGIEHFRVFIGKLIDMGWIGWIE